MSTENEHIESLKGQGWSAAVGIDLSAVREPLQEAILNEIIGALVRAGRGKSIILYRELRTAVHHSISGRGIQDAMKELSLSYLEIEYRASSASPQQAWKERD